MEKKVILTGITTDHLKEAASWWDLFLRLFVEDLMSEKT